MERGGKEFLRWEIVWTKAQRQEYVESVQEMLINLSLDPMFFVKGSAWRRTWTQISHFGKICL
jgi:hypothetical protein